MAQNRLGVQRTPTTDMTAEQLGIVPGSALDTPRGRANRAEQMRRAAEHAVDQTTMQGGTQPGGTTVAAPQPDARARARAADYMSAYTGWKALGPDGRRERIRSIINAQLAREGIPPVTVIFGDKAPGHAVFTAGMWTMALSEKSVDALQISATDFATLVDNAVHETQHVVTTFRGLRVAMAAKADKNEPFNDKVYIPDRIVEQASAANQRRHPNKELDPHAYDEALEIYQISIEPERTAGRKVPPGGVDREAVLDRKEKANKALSDRKSEYDVALAEAGRHQNDPAWAATVAAARAAHQQAQREAVAAHNAYLALPEETYSWRAGSAVKSAVGERIALQERLDQARARAFAGSQAAEQEAAQLRAQIEALTSREAKLVGGRREMREVPLTEAEIINAPKAPVPDDTLGGPGTKAAAGGRRPGPNESSPLPAGAVEAPAPKAGPGSRADAAKAAATITPGQQPAGVKRTVVAAPGGGIGVDWAKEKETTEGDVTHKSDKGGGIAVGGDNVVGISGRSSSATTVGDVSGTVTTTGGVGLTKEGNLEAKVGKTEEIAHGVDAKGEPIKSSKSTTGGVTLSARDSARTSASRRPVRPGPRAASPEASPLTRRATSRQRPATACPARAGLASRQPSKPAIRWTPAIRSKWNPGFSKSAIR